MASRGTSKNTPKTPSKTKLNTSDSSSPYELKTPVKAAKTEVARTVFTHASTLQSVLGDWERLRVRGTTVCRAVLSLQLHECEENEYPARLSSLADSLAEALSGMLAVLESMQLLDKQLQALTRLQPGDEPVIGTWSVGRVAQEIREMCLEYQREYDLKKHVAESVAHCRDEAVSETLASAWELEAHTNPDRQLYLFTEFGIHSS